MLGLASNVPLAGIERSCKFSQGGLSRERLLMGQAPDQLAGTPLALAHVTLDMPSGARSAYEHDYQRANFVYLGFDGTADSLSYRFYLEFPVNLAHQLDPATGQLTKALWARGYKWDALGPDQQKHDVTEYWWHPRLTVEQISRKVNALVSQQSDAAKALTGKAIDLARLRSNALEWQFLEATEPASARHSFDLNLYQADVRLTELTAELTALGSTMGIPSDEVTAFMRDAGASTLGHVSGGLGRDGLPFITLYYADPE
jgi:tryptophan halogenase